MTTLAYKDGVIAFDSRINEGGGRIVSDDYNKATKVNGVTFVLAGATSDFQKIIELYFGEGDDVTADAHGFVVDNGALGIIGCSKTEGYWVEPWDITKHRAIGSGSDHALTAMDLGMSAKAAVKQASKRDAYTGGRIREIKLWK